jgi:hypothetical protein
MRQDASLTRTTATAKGIGYDTNILNMLVEGFKRGALITTIANNTSVVPAHHASDQPASNEARESRRAK